MKSHVGGLSCRVLEACTILLVTWIARYWVVKDCHWLVLKAWLGGIIGNFGGVLYIDLCHPYYRGSSDALNMLLFPSVTSEPTASSNSKFYNLLTMILNFV